MTKFTAASFAGPRAFARHMLQGDRLTLAPLPGSMRAFGGIAMECVLFRQSCWQVELITMLPGIQVPQHRHLRVRSADLALGGDGAGVIGGRPMGQGQRGGLCSNLLRIEKNVWHSGFAGPQGVMFLSFQQWDGPPALISDDWDTA